MEHEHELDMRGIGYPVLISELSIFERNNDISINGFGYEDEDFFPLRITNEYDASLHEICFK